MCDIDFKGKSGVHDVCLCNDKKRRNSVMDRANGQTTQLRCMVSGDVMVGIMCTDLVDYFYVLVSHGLISGASGHPDPPLLRRCCDAACHDDAVQQMGRVPVGQIVRVTQGPGVAFRVAVESGREDLGLEAIEFCPIH